MTTYADWCAVHDCGHAHCSRHDCEHPQPLFIGGVLVCRRCWFVHGETSPMEPCGPENCEEAT